MQPRDKASMLDDNTTEFFSWRIYTEIELSFQSSEMLFVLVIKHGRRDIMCKPAIRLLSEQFIRP